MDKTTESEANPPASTSETIFSATPSYPFAAEGSEQEQHSTCPAKANVTSEKTSEKPPRDEETKKTIRSSGESIKTSPLRIALITAALTLISTLVVQYMTNYWTFENQVKIADRQKRQEAFGQLMGQKFVTAQTYVSRFEALTYFHYHESLWKLEKYPKHSLNLQEALHWKQKSENLALEIAKNNQKLFEIVGLILTLYPLTPKLEGLVSSIYHFKTPVIVPPPPKSSAPELEFWKTQTVSQLQELVEREHARPIDNLLDYLQNELAHQSTQ